MRFALVVSALLALAGRAEAGYALEPAPMREAGMLTCVLDMLPSNVSSAGRVRCIFQRSGQSTAEHYAGELERRADAPLPTQIFSWIVLTAGGETRPGVLVGVLGGAPTEKGAVVATGTRKFVNERGDDILLEPFTGAATSLSLALGKSSLAVRPPML